MREAVRWFAGEMEKKLKANDHKRHWSTLHQDYLIERLFQEAHDLWREVAENESPSEMIKEAVDVANFAMMIADNQRRKEEKTVAKARVIESVIVIDQHPEGPMEYSIGKDIYGKIIGDIIETNGTFLVYDENDELIAEIRNCPVVIHYANAPDENEK